MALTMAFLLLHMLLYLLVNFQMNEHKSRVCVCVTFFFCTKFYLFYFQAKKREKEIEINK